MQTPLRALNSGSEQHKSAGACNILVAFSACQQLLSSVSFEHLHFDKRFENTIKIPFLERASSACSNLASPPPQTEPSCIFKGEILTCSQSCPRCDPIKISGMKYLPVLSVTENPVLRLDRRTQLLTYTPPQNCCSSGNTELLPPLRIAGAGIGMEIEPLL